MVRLENFNLGGNPGLDRSTLIGHLAFGFRNLKYAKQIDGLNLQGS